MTRQTVKTINGQLVHVYEDKGPAETRPKTKGPKVSKSIPVEMRENDNR